MATFRASTSLSAATRTNSTLSKPTGTATGDIWYIVVNAETAFTGEPSGFQTGVISDHIGNVNNLGVWWRRIDGSEGASVTVSHASAWSEGFSAAVQTPSAEVDPWFGITRQGSGTTITANGVTTLGNDAYVAFICNTFGDTSKTTPSGSTPTFTERHDNGNNVAVADGTLATAGATGDKTSTITSGTWSGVLMVIEDDGTTSGAPPPHVVMTAGQTLTTNDPAVAFGGAYVPNENDVVALFPSSATVLGVVVDGSLPSGWVNPLGSGVEVNSDAHGLGCVYHKVTSSEASGDTTTYTATDALDAAETGYVHGVILRNIDPTTPIDSANSAFDSANTVTPHVLASLTGANLSTGSIVVSSVAADSTGTYTAIPTGWSFLLNSATNNGRATLVLNTLTTASSDVTATNITPSVGDEYASITIAFTKAAVAAVEGAVDSATLTLTGVDVTAAGTGAATVAVDAATLTLTGVDPAAAGSGVATVAADTATLTLTGQEVVASAGAIAADVDPAVLTLTGQEVTAAGTGSSTVAVDVATLTLTGETPAAAGTGTASTSVDPAALTLTGQTPAAAGSGTATVAVDPATLVLSGQDIVANTSGGPITQPVDPATLTLTGQTPAAAGTGTASIAVDPATLTLAGAELVASGTGTATAVAVDAALLTLTGQEVAGAVVPLFVIGRATSTLVGAAAATTLLDTNTVGSDLLGGEATSTTLLVEV